MRAARFIPAIVWTAVIIKLLLTEDDGLPRFWWLQFPYSDKLIHAGIFGVNSLLLLYALRNQMINHYRLGIIGLILIWTFLFGAGTELMQHHFLTTRSGDVYDLLADMVGGMMPIVWFYFSMNRAH